MTWSVRCLSVAPADVSRPRGVTRPPLAEPSTRLASPTNDAVLGVDRVVVEISGWGQLGDRSAADDR